MATRNLKSDTQLEDDVIVDTVRSFIAVQARDWVRRQQNAVIPRVLRLVDDARAAGDAVDAPALIRQVWLERQMPTPQLDSAERHIELCCGHTGLAE